MSQERPLNIEESAKYLEVPRRTFESWWYSDSPPPCIRIGKRPFFWPRELTKWATKHGKGKRG